MSSAIPAVIGDELRVTSETGRAFENTTCGRVLIKQYERLGTHTPPLGFSGVTPSDINNLGWISGFGGLLGFGHAAAWKPNGSTYTPIDMGLLPGTTSSNAIGIDDNNRAVGYASTSSGVQTPFMWTEAAGMVNLIRRASLRKPRLGSARVERWPRSGIGITSAILAA